MKMKNREEKLEDRRTRIKSSYPVQEEEYENERTHKIHTDTTIKHHPVWNIQKHS